MIAPPHPTILWAALLSVTFPAVLLALSHYPFKVAAPGRRFIAAWGLLVLGWLILLFGTSSEDRTLADLAAALMIFGAAIPVSFMCWSVLCWGVTLNMLVYLETVRRPVSREEWERGYAGPDGIAGLIADRAGILFRAGLAVPARAQGSIMLTRRGRVAARLAAFMPRIFSVTL